MVLGGVVYTAVPFYKRARQIEGTDSNTTTSCILLLISTGAIAILANSAEISSWVVFFGIDIQVLTEIMGLIC
jgi:hypothetical protein